jgi:hypothetical protein
MALRMARWRKRGGDRRVGVDVENMEKLLKDGWYRRSAGAAMQ